MRTSDDINMAIVEFKKLCAKHNLSPIDVSMHINVLPTRIYEILNGKRRFTVDTDLRLTKFFQLKKGYFIKHQIEYDLLLEERNLEDKLSKIETVFEIVKKGDIAD